MYRLNLTCIVVVFLIMVHFILEDGPGQSTWRARWCVLLAVHEENFADSKLHTAHGIHLRPVHSTNCNARDTAEHELRHSRYRRSSAHRQPRLDELGTLKFHFFGPVRTLNAEQDEDETKA